MVDLVGNNLVVVGLVDNNLVAEDLVGSSLVVGSLFFTLLTCSDSLPLPFFIFILAL